MAEEMGMALLNKSPLSVHSSGKSRSGPKGATLYFASGPTGVIVQRRPLPKRLRQDSSS